MSLYGKYTGWSKKEGKPPSLVNIIRLPFTQKFQGPVINVFLSSLTLFHSHMPRGLYGHEGIHSPYSYLILLLFSMFSQYTGWSRKISRHVFNCIEYLPNFIIILSLEQRYVCNKVTIIKDLPILQTIRYTIFEIFISVFKCLCYYYVHKYTQNQLVSYLFIHKFTLSFNYLITENCVSPNTYV